MAFIVSCPDCMKDWSFDKEDFALLAMILHNDLKDHHATYEEYTVSADQALKIMEAKKRARIEQSNNDSLIQQQ